MPTPPNEQDLFTDAEYIPCRNGKDGFWLTRIYEPDPERCLEALRILWENKPRSSESKVSRKKGARNA